MSLSYIERVSEAPQDRVEEIHQLLETLDLPDARLSTEQLELVVNTVSARPDLWQDLVVDDRESRWWLLLFRTPSFEVKIHTWQAEQASDWHDHGGSSGAMRVTQGSLRESHRTKDGVGVRESIFTPGGFGSFGTDYVHDVVHETGEPAVSIHAYSPPLSGLTYYERTRFGFVARAFVEEERRSLFRTPHEDATTDPTT